MSIEAPIGTADRRWPAQAIEPTVTVTSVGRKPSTDGHQKYAYHCKSVFSTRYYGTVRLEISEDRWWGWYVDRNAG
jgi:hypothetical protein